MIYNDSNGDRNCQWSDIPEEFRQEAAHSMLKQGKFLIIIKGWWCKLEKQERAFLEGILGTPLFDAGEAHSYADDNEGKQLDKNAEIGKSFQGGFSSHSRAESERIFQTSDESGEYDQDLLQGLATGEKSLEAPLTVAGPSEGRDLKPKKPRLGSREQMEGFRALVKQGYIRAAWIAEVSGLKPYQVSRLAKRAIKAGWLVKQGMDYAMRHATGRPRKL